MTSPRPIDYRTPRGRLHLPKMLDRLVRAGTRFQPAAERSHLVAANVTGYLATVSSCCYAVSYALQDFASLKALVAGNIISAAITASTPLFHRYGPTVAGLVLTATIFSTIFYFIAMLGHDSGIQLNYLAAAAITFLVLGIHRIRLVVTIILLAAVLHIAAWFLFPTGHLADRLPPDFLSQTYTLSAISMTAIISVVVFYVLRLLRREQFRSNALLLNVLPASIADRLMQAPDQTIARRHEQASVLFADLCGFTPLTAKLSPADLITLLDRLFSAFDAQASRLGVEKIKTIGDAYMVVSGAPEPRDDHATALVELSKAMIAATLEVAASTGHDLSVRIGIASGGLTAGVIGQSKFAYDVWGNTVNRAARLETCGAPGDITIDQATKELLAADVNVEFLGDVDLKGIGPTPVWRLLASQFASRKSGS